MLSFSTDDIAPEQRFEYWREIRGKNLFGVTIEVAPERRNRFHGSFRAHMVGGAIASEMQASAYRVSRTASDIAKVAGDSLCLGHQVRGSGLLNAGRDRICMVWDGDMTVSHSDLPFAGTPNTENDFHFRLLKIPLQGDLTLGRPVDGLFAAKLSSGPQFIRPFRALFDALVSPRARIIDPTADIVHVARLALATRGELNPKQPEVRAAVRAGVHYLALEVLERDKHRPNLTPAVVAGELGISVRQLHMLFERAGLSFARTLSSMRLELARRLLVEMPSLSITQIAYASGFESLATFYRLFASTYGMPPGSARQA